MLLNDREQPAGDNDSPVLQPEHEPVRQPTLAGTGSKADNRHKFARTMLGLAPLPAPGEEPSGQAPPSVHESTDDSAQRQEPAPERPKSKHQTMLGLAFNLPQPEPKNEAKRTLVGSGELTPPTHSAVPFTEAAKGTLIGVAVPGIAPINPGVTKAPTPDTLDSPAPEVVDGLREDPSVPIAPPAAHHTVSRALLWTLAGVAGALALVSLAAYLRWRAVPKLDVKVESDEMGRDALLVDCSNCDDGQVLSVDDAKSELRGHHAKIPLRTALKIGDNHIKLWLTRGAARPEGFEMRVPVEFRVTGDTTALDENPAKLRLRIEKTPAVQFQVEHAPVAFDAAGRGVYEVDISNELTGPSAQEGVLEKRISYQVRGPSGNFEGALLLRAAATPLVVTSPGSVLVTEGQDLRICGHTDPRAHVDIAGLQTKTDNDGHFCNAAVIREFGQFEVWIGAKRPAAAPRKVKLSIERTANLRQYAKDLYARVRHEIQQEKVPAAGDRSSLVALTGVVVEQSRAGDVHRYLLKYDAADGTRFARINSFSTSASKTGVRLTVFGEPVGTLDGPDGRKMEELNSAFEVPAIH